MQGAHIDHETVFHIVALQALKSAVDVLHGNHFAVGQDLMFGAEIQQFLNRLNSADQRAHQTAVIAYQQAAMNVLQRFYGAHQHQQAEPVG